MDCYINHFYRGTQVEFLTNEGRKMKKYDFYLCNKTHPEGTLLTSWCRKGMDEVQEQSFELLDFLGLTKTEIETIEEEEEDEFFGDINVFSEQDVADKNII